MFNRAIDIGCFILSVEDKYNYIVQRFSIRLDLDSIPASQLIVKNAQIISVSKNDKLPKLNKIQQLYKIFTQAQSKRQLLKVKVIQYNKGNKRQWFKGVLCSVSITGEANTEQSSLYMTCNCMHQLCQLQYNYLTQSVYTPGVQPLTFDVASKLYNFTFQGATGSRSWQTAIKDIYVLMTKSKPNLSTDSVLQLANKGIKQLIEARKQRYKKTFSLDSPILKNFDLNKYFKTDYFVTKIISSTEKSASQGTSSSSWKFLQFFYSYIANNVISGTLARSLLQIFSGNMFLRVVPSGKSEEDNRLKIVPSSFDIYNQKPQTTLQLKHISQGFVAYNALGTLNRPQALIVAFDPNKPWEGLRDKQKNVSMKDFGVYPAELRSGNIDAKQVSFSQGPSWMNQVSTKVETVSKVPPGKVDPRANTTKTTPIPQIKDIFAKQIYFSKFAHYSSAVIDLVPSQQTIFQLDKHLGQTFKFQLTPGYNNGSIQKVKYYGILGSVSFEYNSSIAASRLRIRAGFNFVMQEDSKDSDIFTKKNEYNLYQKKK